MRLSKLIKSTVFSVLFLFTPLLALHMVESPFVVPEYHFHLITSGVMRGEKGNVVTGTIGAGITSSFSLYLEAPFLVFNRDEGELSHGDPMIKGKFLLYSHDPFNLTLVSSLLLPMGHDMYGSDSWAGLEEGNDRFALGFAASYRFRDLFVHLNCVHNFQAAENENLLDRFTINPVNLETYVSVLGLNPFVKGGFLSGDALSNDWFLLGMACNSDKYYPLVPSIELVYVSPYTNSAIDVASDGVGESPLKLGAGGSYFFTRVSYVEFFGVKSFFVSEGYADYLLGLKGSVLF